MTSIAPYFIVINRSDSQPVELTEKQKQVDFVITSIFFGGILAVFIFYGIILLYDHFRK